jgi:hypothetical protein
MLIWRLLCFGALVCVALGCRDDKIPYVVLTTTHFRIHVHPDVGAPDDRALERLEGDYRDARTFLKFPDAIIDYYFFPSAESAGAACFPGRAAPPSACAKGSSVYSWLFPDHHELIHAYLSAVGSPPPLLREGVAQGIYCGSRSVTGAVPPWQSVVDLAAYDQPSVYDAGLYFFVYLVRMYGIDRFVSYYAQAPFTLDAGAFQSNFESFWGISLDSTWQNMQLSRVRTSQSAAGPAYAICPCTQPVTLPLDGRTIGLNTLDTNALPFPDADIGPYFFSAMTATTTLRNCEQDDLRLTFNQAGIAVAKLLPERHYFEVSPQNSIIGQKGMFVAMSCVEAQAAPIPSGYVGPVNMLVPETSDATSPVDWWSHFMLTDGPRTIRVHAPSLGSQTLDVCSACPGNEGTGACTSIVSGGGDVTINAPGPDVILHAGYSTGVPGKPAYAPVSTFSILP